MWAIDKLALRVGGEKGDDEADTYNRDDPDYLAALETETAILEKRVRACCSRIMVVTCFDVTAA